MRILARIPQGGIQDASDQNWSLEDNQDGFERKLARLCLRGTPEKIRLRGPLSNAAKRPSVQGASGKRRGKSEYLTGYSSRGVSGIRDSQADAYA